MDFLIQSAMAGGGEPQGNPMLSLLFMVGILVLFFFLFIRPQQKRVKEHRQMVSELKVGDEVVTNGGLVGRIAEVDESFLTLNIAKNVDVRIQKDMIARLLPKGTLDT